MKDAQTPPKQTQAAPKQGFFTRIINKLDDSMKAKADEKAKQSSCCSGSDKGGKCC